MTAEKIQIAMKKDDYEDKPLDHLLAERCLFHMCITCDPNTQRIYMLSNICTTEVFLFAVLSQWKWGGEGDWLHAIVSQMEGKSIWKNVQDKICRINPRKKIKALQACIIPCHEICY